MAVEVEAAETLDLAVREDPARGGSRDADQCHQVEHAKAREAGEEAARDAAAAGPPGDQRAEEQRGSP